MGALDDPQVLELAARDDRILVTRNSRDFAPLLREWAEADRHHAGCILIWTLGHHEFGAIIKGVDRVLHDRPDAERWLDLAVRCSGGAAEAGKCRAACRDSLFPDRQRGGHHLVTRRLDEEDWTHDCCQQAEPDS